MGLICCHSLVTTLFLSPQRARNGWFLVPIFAPFLGAIIGVMIYQVMVGFHVEGEARDQKERMEEESVRLTNVNSKANSKEVTKEMH